MPDIADTASAAEYHARPEPFSNADRAKFALILLLLAVVWGYARFGSDRPTPPTLPAGIGAFENPVQFLAAPGGNFSRINVRSGPGGEYRILEKVTRGTPLTGIARAADTNGASWIELANGRGYTKESVLVVNGGP